MEISRLLKRDIHCDFSLSAFLASVDVRWVKVGTCTRNSKLVTHGQSMLCPRFSDIVKEKLRMDRGREWRHDASECASVASAMFAEYVRVCTLQYACVFYKAAKKSFGMGGKLTIRSLFYNKRLPRAHSFIPSELRGKGMPFSDR